MGSSSKHPGLYKRGAYWWLTRDPVSGKPTSTRCTDLKAARAIQAERERLAADPAYAAAHKATLQVSCGEFVKMKTEAGRAKATLGYYNEKLGHWLRLFGDDAPLVTFADPRAFDRYVSQRRTEDAAESTIAKEVKVFKQVLAMAKRVGEYAGDLTILKPHDLEETYDPRERALPSEEVQLLWPELGPKLAALLDVSIALGLRLSEAVKIEPGDVDVERGIVHIRGTKTKKSNRIVPVISLFRPLLERALPSLPIGAVPNNLYRDLAAACRRVGIERCTTNDFRRSNATILAEHGVDPDVIRRLLGHTTNQMVNRVYSRPRPEALGRLAERAIATMERSSDVVTPAQGDTKPDDGEERKSAEPVTVPPTGADQNGFLSRRSHVRTVPGALVSADSATLLSQACSELPIPLLALGYAALFAGVLPSNDVDSSKGVA